MTLPDFIVVGEVRCGTTSLFEDLIKHPDINPPLPSRKDTYENGSIGLSQKEPRFFDRYWSNGLDWYANHFNGKGVTGEASATYLYRTLAMARIKEVCPAAKIIVMLRNPTDRLCSHFNHMARIDPEWLLKYESLAHFMDKASESDYYLVDKGIYASSVRKCLQLFDRSQVLIIKSEDLFGEPANTIGSVHEFLGVEPYDLFEFSHLRDAPALPSDQETLTSIEKFYKPFNDELYDLIGRDMKWDNQ